MIAPNLDGRLLCASTWAYALEEPGPIGPLGPYDLGSGLGAGVVGFTTGSSQIDAAFVGTGPDGVVLSFRGTLPTDSANSQQTLRDWLNNLEIALVPGDKLPGLVHHGFLGALDALWDSIATEVADQMAASPVKRLNVTGHSKGGAMAHLAAARFALSTIVHGSDISVRSYGGAHPGDAGFAETYARLVPDAIRYEYRDDLVPHIAPSLTMRQLFATEPLFAMLMLSGPNVAYAPAGQLKFIDWSNQVRGASTLLSTERLFHLSQRLATGDFTTVVNDHSVDFKSGTMHALCPSLAG